MEILQIRKIQPKLLIPTAENFGIKSKSSEARDFLFSKLEMERTLKVSSDLNYLIIIYLQNLVLFCPLVLFRPSEMCASNTQTASYPVKVDGHCLVKARYSYSHEHWPVLSVRSVGRSE